VYWNTEEYYDINNEPMPLCEEDVIGGPWEHEHEMCEALLRGERADKAEAERDEWKAEAGILRGLVEDLKEDVRCPECGCATPEEADLKECGCDAPVCQIEVGTTLAKEYEERCGELARAEALNAEMLAMLKRAIGLMPALSDADCVCRAYEMCSMHSFMHDANALIAKAEGA